MPFREPSVEAARLALENGPDSFIWWSWVGDNIDLIVELLIEHLYLTIVAVVGGILIGIPLALVAWRRPRSRNALLGTAGVLYTIPSIAMLFLLGPITGFTTQLTVVVTLTIYTLLIIMRNVITGLEGVPAEAVEAATGMGYSGRGLLWGVELPLAMPSILAGIRIATVTTIGLVTLGALVTHGGLGELILDGINRSFSTPLVVGSVLSVLLAVLADFLLRRLERALTPWNTRAAT